MTAPRIVLPPLAHPVDLLWHVLLDLALVDAPWTLVGGQMVLLHALEHGVVPPQVSQDGDVVADLRANSSAARTIVAALDLAGFRLEAITPEGVAHRYVRDAVPRPVVVDVLAPEGLGRRADLSTTPPGHTVEVPGGSQALTRSELVEIAHEGRLGHVSRPSLLAAIVLKGAACGLPGGRSRHERDLAFLCSLVADPIAVRAEMSAKDVRRVRIARLVDPAHPAWMLLPPAHRGQGIDAYGFLTT